MWICDSWKVPVFGVFLVRIFPHLDWIRKDTEHLGYFYRHFIQTLNTDTFVNIFTEKSLMKNFVLLCSLTILVSRIRNRISSHRRFSVKRGVLANFPTACNFIKKRHQHKIFSYTYIRTIILNNICERLPLHSPQFFKFISKKEKMD